MGLAETAVVVTVEVVVTGSVGEVKGAEGLPYGSV
jgi:hypothetical protein